jgi:hypothetical protein
MVFDLNDVERAIKSSILKDNMGLVEIGLGCLNCVRDLGVLGYLKMSSLKDRSRKRMRGDKEIQICARKRFDMIEKEYESDGNAATGTTNDSSIV